MGSTESNGNENEVEVYLSQGDIHDSFVQRFESEIANKVPRVDSATRKIVNRTEVRDLGEALSDCARQEYGLNVDPGGIQILGKFESGILGGSVKTRPAAKIVEDAVRSGRLRKGQIVFEATSGNFGVALGLLRKLGLRVVLLVSRRLQEGVIQELKSHGAMIIDLDVDICPAPGMKMDADLIAVKAFSSNVRTRLQEFGLDPTVFDGVRSGVEDLLAKQDVINLAKLLAGAYDGFCPEQYDNESNLKAHETITGPEIDQQLEEMGHSLADFDIVCTFGTGGTSTGLSRYILDKYSSKGVHVIFPLSGQDVAGIRTKDKALGLRFYQPQLYAGEHEIDFEAAKPLLKFFVSRGYDIGESSALALYATLQMVNYGVGRKFIVLLPDGIQKYFKSLETIQKRRPEATLSEVRSASTEFGEVVWMHTMYAPKEEGIGLIASSLGVDVNKVKVARARDVESLVMTGRMTEDMRKLFQDKEKETLLVCISGGTSLRAAEVLASTGVKAVSLSGGILSLSAGSGKTMPELVKPAPR